MEEAIRELLDSTDQMVDELRMLVESESPSTDKAMLDRTAGIIADYGKRMLGSDPEIVDNPNAGRNMIFRLNSSGEGKPVLILTHYDTVWPEGTIERMPFSVDGNTITGPGTFDMKSGIVQGFRALNSLLNHGLLSKPVTVLCTSDEETGSENSRALIEEEARKACCVIVLEASKDGMVKTGRKGVGRFTLEVTGKAAHAGLDHKNGVSAIEELSRLIMELHIMTDYSKGTTVNVGVVSGGTRSNVVAARARAEIDLRIETMAEAERVSGKIFNLKPHLMGSSITVSGGLNRPPMERTEGNVKLFEKARMVAEEIGIGLEDCVVGGASDGNFCSALGVPVLDGMGAVGGNAHAEGEHVLKDSIAPRSALLALLLLELQKA